MTTTTPTKKISVDGLELLPLPAAQSRKEAAAVLSHLEMEVTESLPVDLETVDAWRQLTDNPMSGPDWLLPWWEHYGTDRDRLQLVMFFAGRQLVSVAPLYLENGRDFKLLGSGKVCSDYSELLIGDPVWVDRAETLLIDWLMSDDSPRWRSMHLEAIDSDSKTLQMAHGWNDRLTVSDLPGESVCTIALPADWEQYLKSLSKNHRKRVRRWTRQHLETEQVQTLSTESGWSLEEAFECLIHLHNLRRSDLPEKGAFECEQFLGFHWEAFFRLAERGQAAISAILIDGEPVAIEYELCNGDTAFAYQSGADTSVTELGSPGSVSLMCRLQAAVANGKKTYDLMRGDEGYKSHWKGELKVTRNVTLWPSTFAGNLARLKFDAKRKLRSVASFAKSQLKKRNK